MDINNHMPKKGDDFNGMVTNEDTLTDEMYENVDLHNENGQWQMIFGVNTIPEYRRQGCAEKLMRKVISDVKDQGRKGLVLTCKDSLIHYYEKFGFKNEGISDSTHGGAIWYNMRLTFKFRESKDSYLNCFPTDFRFGTGLKLERVVFSQLFTSIF